MNNKILPNLLIIGAAKSGTTSLHKYLDQHPEIFMSKKKEPRFFLVWNDPEQIEIHKKQNIEVFNNFNTLEKYQSLFAGQSHFKIRGESSPQYLSNPKCAVRIKMLLPDVKLIAILRNPVDRAFSHYIMNKNWGLEKLSFEEAINEEIKNGRVSHRQDMRYLVLGKYSDALKSYMDLFQPEQLKIFLHEELNMETTNVVKEVFDFLDVENSFQPNLAKYNVSFLRRFKANSLIDKILYKLQRAFTKFHFSFLQKKIKKYRFYKPPLSEALRQRLIEYYLPEITTLENLLKKDLSAWKK